MKNLVWVCLIVVAITLASCSSDKDGIDPKVRKYYSAVDGYSLESWEDDNKSTVYWTAFLGNAIPGVHLVGVWVDTVVMLSEAKELAMGNGAIIAMQNNCPELVSPNDYYLIQALWVGAVTQPRLQSAFRDAREVIKNSKSGQKFTQRLAARQLTKLLSEKIGVKVGTKIFLKYSIKVISKKVLGLAPILGGIAAVLINKFFFMDPIDSASENYFKLKASTLCD